MKQLLLIAVLLIAGCNASSVQWQSNPTDPNSPTYHLVGQAADTMVEVMAKNVLTAQGRMNDLQKYNAEIYAGLIFAFVIGMIVSIWTRSKYLWIIPVSCLAGISLITFWAIHAKKISLAIVVVCVCVGAWKLIEYQRERNKESEKIKELQG